MTDAAILTVSETHRLDALEGVIERGKAAFVEVGEALEIAEIIDCGYIDKAAS